jgi:hypothetical protein
MANKLTSSAAHVIVISTTYNDKLSNYNDSLLAFEPFLDARVMFEVEVAF